MELVEKIARPVRKFLPEDFQVTSWNVLEAYFNHLLQRKLESPDDLKKWFHDRSELESVIGEDLAWRYIRMTCYTENGDYSKAYQDFIQNIQPKIAPVADQLNKKAASSPYLNELADREGYAIMIRS
jgi:oligoendopeptidase F